MTTPNTTSSATAQGTPFRPRASDAYYHANAKGTGSAVRFELHPAHDTVAGSVFASLAMQRTLATNQDGNRVFPTFDWKNGITLKLDRTDLSQILQVLRGMQESIADGKGLFHRSATANTIIKFAHQIEPRPGYVLSVSRKTQNGDLANAYFIFDVSEAFSLMLALERAMLYVCFGIPEVIPRTASPANYQPRVDFTPRPAPVAAQPAAAAPAPHPEPLEEDYLAVSGDPF